MPSKKKKYNARFPAGRIKKIMQTDEEVGKVAQAVPIIISRTLELFVESLLTKSAQITQARNAKTLTPSHMKQCILSESRFDFLKDLVKNIPDAVTLIEDSEAVVSEPEYSGVPTDPMSTVHTIAPPIISPSSSLKQEFAPNFYTEQGPSKPTPVIQYGASGKSEPYGASVKSEPFASSLKSEPKLDFSIENLVKKEEEETQKIHLDLTNVIDCEVPPLIPLARNIYQGTSDNLFIDEDYDN